MTEPEPAAETEVATPPEPRKYRLHGGRCCSAIPPILAWNDEIEAVVCHSCGRVWAPVILDLDDAITTTIIRAYAVVDGCQTKTGRMLNQNRHAIRRKLDKYKITITPDLIVPYAAPGPGVKDLSP